MILHEKTIKFQPSIETGVKGVFFIILWTMSYFVSFCFVNSSVNFAKQFCWLAIRLGSEEGIGRRGLGPY